MDLKFKDSSNNVIDLNTLTPGEHIVTATYYYDDNSGVPPTSRTKTININVTPPVPLTFSFEQGQFNQRQLANALKNDPSDNVLDLKFKDSSDDVIDLNTLAPGEHTVTVYYAYKDNSSSPLIEVSKTININVTPPVPLTFSFEQGQFNQRQLVDALADDPSDNVWGLDFKDSSNNVIDLNTLTPGEHTVTATYDYDDRSSLPTSRTKTINITVTPPSSVAKFRIVAQKFEYESTFSNQIEDAFTLAANNADPQTIIAKFRATAAEAVAEAAAVAEAFGEVAEAAFRAAIAAFEQGTEAAFRVAAQRFRDAETYAANQYADDSAEAFRAGADAFDAKADEL